MKHNFQKSFTLIEILVYIFILTIIIFVISSFVIWGIRVNTKAKVMREVMDNSRRAMEIMTYEIRESGNVYDPTSSFSFNPGQLSLITTKYLLTDENSAYVDFFICDSRLCLKKEGQNPIVLTSDQIEIENLVFSKIVTGNNASVQIDLKVKYKDTTGKPEYRASVNLRSVASLRSY